MRDVISPRLRELGFKGSGRRWVKSNSRGDVCVVGLEIDKGYEPFQILFQAGAVPKAWDDWLRGPYSAISFGGDITKRPMHYHGLDVWTLTGPGEDVADFWPVRSPQAAISYLADHLTDLDRFASTWLDPEQALRKVASGDFEPYGYLDMNPMVQEAAVFLMSPPSSTGSQRARSALVDYRGLTVWEEVFARTVAGATSVD